MARIKHLLADELSDALGTDIAPRDVEEPDPEHGDYAYPVMQAAAEIGDNPREMAEAAADELEEGDIIADVDVAGPGYLNMWLDREAFAREIVDTLEQDSFGVEQRDGSVLVEFSSPNVAKPMHVGHFRNNALGDALQRILRFVGYDVTSENYLGDWGTQYGKLIYAFKEFGSEEAFEEAPMEHMYELYVKFHDEMEENKELEEKGRAWAAKIEDGDEEAVELWERFRDASIEYHKKDYRRMGIDFDRWTGESTVVEPARELIEQWLDAGKLERDDDGSVFIEFQDHDLPGTVLLKADGSTLYITRDLYNLKKRNEEGFDHNLYVVGSEQELHFQQVFATADEMGLDPSGSEHISYGLLSLPEGSMSSRAGRIVRLEDAMDEATKRAKEKAEEKMDRTVENAEAIGIGALKYANLAVSRTKDIEFSWDRALSFEGDSGPYLQYSNTRAKSITAKAETDGELVGEPTDEETELLRKLAAFPDTVEAAAEQREPANLANYLSALCEEFNSFYHSCPVIQADEETKKRRLKIVETFIDVTDQGMELLGIEPLAAM
ncbi:MAG: arginine--tRNA ligase [Candidatus Nanohaloarchaea archaeon]|nr:arginine--tRNA ligase [Candidatus Nanohaloarchaea archaeon]